MSTFRIIRWLYVSFQASRFDTRGGPYGSLQLSCVEGYILMIIQKINLANIQYIHTLWQTLNILEYTIAAEIRYYTTKTVVYLLIKGTVVE